MFRGALTALVTPFKDNALDEDAFRAHIDRQIKGGIDGLVPCGTTGESPTLSHEEHKRVIEITVSEAKGRVPVLAGTGSNNTAEAIEFTAFAKKAGADGALVIAPYYNKPTPEGIYRHFKAIADEVALPIVAYNVPGRTVTDLTPPVVARLASISGVVGIKEATGLMNRASEIIASTPRDFLVLSGDDFTVLPLLSVGGHGVISVVTNLVPGEMAAMIKAYQAGDTAEAKRLHYKLYPLTEALFLETSPIPVKAAMAMLGFITPEIRLPLCPISEANRKKLETALAAYCPLEGKG